MTAPAFTIAIIAAMILGIVPHNAHAQEFCAPRDTIVKSLSAKYGEFRRGAGLSGSSEIFEIWASETTGTWTILKTTPNGKTCVVAVGEGWHDGQVKKKIVGDGA